MTKLYLSKTGTAFAPATIRGSWNRTTDGVVRGMHTSQDDVLAGAPTATTASENSTVSGFSSLAVRAVSAPLEFDHTFGGTLNLMLAVREDSSNANMAYHVHVYVTQGNSDVVRGTLITNYSDPDTNEWPTTAAGKPLLAAQSVTSVAALAGDRIVAEIGFDHYNTSVLSYTGSIYTGGNGSDLASGGTATSGVGFIEFSDTFTLFSNPSVRVSQLPVETIARPTTANARITQSIIEALRRSTDVNARISQSAVEVIRRNGSAPSVGSQANMVIIVAG